MRFYWQVIVPLLCDFGLDRPFVAKHRRELLAQATGNILKIGIETGLNLACYPPSVRKIASVDPSTGMYRRAQARIKQTGVGGDQRVLSSERLPFEDGTYDCVVSTFILCSIGDVAKALSEVYRVLKKGGHFLFFEHGLSPLLNVQKWQHRLNWLQMRLAGGCNLDRYMRALITAPPFASVEMDEFYLEKIPRTGRGLDAGLVNKECQLPSRQTPGAKSVVFLVQSPRPFSGHLFLDGRDEAVVYLQKCRKRFCQLCSRSVPELVLSLLGKRVHDLVAHSYPLAVLISAALFAAAFGGLLYSLSPPTEQSSLVAGGDPSAASIIGSGQAASKSWDIADFTAVKIESAFQAQISKGNGFKVTTSSDDNVIEYIQVLKEDKTLNIRLKRGQKIQLKAPLKATIVLPVLDALTLRDASKAVLKDFRSEENLQLVVRDASTVEGTLNVGSADFQLHDASTLALRGTAADARLSIHDASHLKLQDFILKQCNIKLADASTARITVRSDRPFSAKLSNSSSLEGSVDAEDLEITGKDSSHATLSGRAKNAELAAANSSDLRLAGLIVDDARIVLSDSSRATIDVRKSLKYVLSSGSRLEYSGHPSILTGSKSREATIRRRQ